MASTPINGIPLPDPGDNDDVPGSMMSAWTAGEKLFIGRFANAADRDSKITSPQGGQCAWLISPGKFTYYDATAAAWADLMNPTAWDSWTPTLRGIGGTAVTLGTGATQIGRYRLTGKGVQFQATWNFGTSVSGPNGQVVFNLPTGLSGANVTGLGQTGGCSLWVPNLSESYYGFWTISPGDTFAQPHFPKSRTISAMDFLKNPTASDGTGGVPQISGTSFNYPLQPNGQMVANGLYQIA